MAVAEHSFQYKAASGDPFQFVPNHDPGVGDIGDDNSSPWLNIAEVDTDMMGLTSPAFDGAWFIRTVTRTSGDTTWVVSVDTVSQKDEVVIVGAGVPIEALGIVLTTQTKAQVVQQISVTRADILSLISGSPTNAEVISVVAVTGCTVELD